jgi:hypothetical protein
VTAQLIPATFQADLEPWIGYIRVSTWREEKISPELQKTAIKGWARHTRRRIVAWIEDLDVSGRTFKRKVMGAIERVERGEARGIAVWRYSRFGRDRVGNAINLARLEAVGGRLESATEPVDAGTAIGRFQRGMIMEFSAFESDRAGEQWKEVHQHRLNTLLLPAAGRPRFGYAWYPRRIPDHTEPTGFRTQVERYEPQHEAGTALADSFEAYLDGTGFVDLARNLNDHGYRSMRGNLWRQDALLRYMDSGFAAGYLRVRDSCNCPKSRKTACRHWRLFRGAHEPLISDETWEQYKIKRLDVAKMPPRTRNPVYDLSGLVRCGLCGGAMSGKPNTNGSVYWRCARADAQGGCTGVAGTYDAMLAEISRFLEDVADGIDTAPAATFKDLTTVATPDIEQERARLTAEAWRFQEGLARLVEDFALNPDRYPDDAYDTARARLEEKRNNALAQLGEFADPEAGEAAPIDPQSLRPVVVGALPEWETFTPGERNAVLRKLMRYMIVSPRPSRYETAAEIVPVWEPERTEWPMDNKGASAIVNSQEPSGALEALPDGIAYKVAQEIEEDDKGH